MIRPILQMADVVDVGTTIESEDLVDLRARRSNMMQLVTFFLVALLLGGAMHVAFADQASAAPVTCNRAGWLNTGESPGAQKLPYHNTAGRNCILQYGDGGDGTGVDNAVLYLQDSLNACYGKGLVPDGDFGTATRTALREVQTEENVGVDGVYGPTTRNAMNWLSRNEATGNNVGCKPYGWSPW